MLNQYPYINYNDLNLDWIIARIKEYDAAVESLEAWKATHEVEYAELKQFMDDIEAGNFTDSMYNAMVAWLEDNSFEIIGNMIKFITPYIDDSGYFCIKFPAQWDSLIFNTTGLDINTSLQPNYGHLTISY